MKTGPVSPLFPHSLNQALHMRPLLRDFSWLMQSHTLFFILTHLKIHHSCRNIPKMCSLKDNYKANARLTNTQVKNSKLDSNSFASRYVLSCFISFFQLLSFLYSFITRLCIPKKHNVILPICEWYLNGITLNPSVTLSVLLNSVFVKAVFVDVNTYIVNLYCWGAFCFIRMLQFIYPVSCCTFEFFLFFLLGYYITAAMSILLCDFLCMFAEISGFPHF